MNINTTLVCDTCGAKTNCRIGLSNRRVQPLHFHCPHCGAPLGVTIDLVDGWKLEGCHQQQDAGSFDDETPFVDLHLDFPVAFGKYVMGATPYMEAFRRVDFVGLELFGRTLKQIDSIEDKEKILSLLLKLFKNDKFTPLKTSAERNFALKLKSNKPADVDSLISDVIDEFMGPFDRPGAVQENVEQFQNIILDLEKSNKHGLEAFLREVCEGGFLKNLQLDCHEIFPRLFAARLPLRAALFLDYDMGFREKPAPMRISTAQFQDQKELYKDISEILARQFSVVAGINNLLKRGDHNKFLEGIGQTANKDYTPASLKAYADVDFGHKLKFIDESWYGDVNTVDNQIRNAIAHFKVEYDEITQKIAYYYSKEGLEQKKGKELSYLEFMHQLLQAYREMRMLYLLIMHLLQYWYIRMGKT